MAPPRSADNPPSPPNSTANSTTRKVTPASYLELSWFSNNIPYLQTLGAHLLVIQEHWIWPFQLQDLSDVHPDITYTAVSDHRLSSDANCGKDVEELVYCGRRVSPSRFCT